MYLKSLAAVAVSLGLAAAAHAQEPQDARGFYLGGGLGQFNAGIDDVDQIPDTVDRWKDNDTAYKIFGGYRLNRFLAFELDYVNLGKPSGQVVPGFNVDSAVDGFAPYAVGSIPLGDYFEVYGRAGYYFYDATTATSDTLDNHVKLKEDSQSFVYGGGVGLKLGEKFHLRAEYERFDIKNLDDADALWLTASWTF